MSRGWEIKDVESQQQLAEQRAAEKAPPKLTPEQIELRSKRESLLLDKKRIQRDIANARHPRHAALLGDALAHIERKLAELGPDPVS